MQFSCKRCALHDTTPSIPGEPEGAEAVLRRGAGPSTGRSVNGDAPLPPEGTSPGQESAGAIGPRSALVTPVSEQLAPGPLAPLGERQREPGRRIDSGASLELGSRSQETGEPVPKPARRNAGAWTVSPSLQRAEQGKNSGSGTQACEEEGVPARASESQVTEKAPERSGQRPPRRIWRTQEGGVWRQDARGSPQQPARLTPRRPPGLSPDARLLAGPGPDTSTGSPPE